MKKKYKVLLFDIDDTLLDFDKAETLSLIECFQKYNISYNDEVINNYKKINLSYWQEYEKGTITIPNLMIARFVDLLGPYRLDLNKDGLIDFAKEFNEYYLSRLNKKNDIIDGADVIIKKLCKDFLIYPASNGVGATQVERVESSKLKGLFSKYYISGFIGFQKPQIEFFNYIFNDLKDIKKEKILMIGDSLTSDILGGINAKIDTCWFNYRSRIKGNVHPTYEIKSLDELLNIVYE